MRGAPDREAQPAAEIGHAVTAPQKVTFTLDADDLGPLTVVLEPDLSPVTTTRLAALVKSGFFKGIVVHRVRPASWSSSAIPTATATAARARRSAARPRRSRSPPSTSAWRWRVATTGSSQIFVTLSRTPHLDGEYTRVGRADGAWASVAQGDVIVDAKLVE